MTELSLRSCRIGESTVGNKAAWFMNGRDIHTMAVRCPTLFRALIRSQLGSFFGDVFLRPFVVARGLAGFVTFGFLHHLYQFHVSGKVRQTPARSEENTSELK